MLKIYSMMAAAALIAGALVITPGLSEVSATTRNPVTQTTSSSKGDRLDMEARLACKQQSWPHLDRTCIRDARTESGGGKTVRVVATTRR